MTHIRSSETALIALTSVAHALAHIYTLTLPAVLILLKGEFGLNDYYAGALATLLNFAFGLGSLPAGVIVDRVGSKRMLLVFLVGAGLASILVGFTNTAVELALSLALLGLMCSIYHPAGLAILSRSCRQRGMALGIHGVGGSVGVAVAPILTGALAAGFGWRVAYMVLGALGFLAAGVLSLARIEESHDELALRHPSDVTAPISPSELIWAFVLVCLVIVCLSISFQGASAFLNMHISQQIKNVSLDKAVFLGNLYTSVAMGVGILGQMAGGYLTDRTRREELLMMLSVVFCVPCLIFIGWTTGLTTAVSAMLYAFFYFFTQPVNNCLIAKYTRARLRGAAFGLTSFLSFGVGSVGATIAGYAATLGGAVWYVFPTMAAAACFSAMCCSILWRLDVARRRFQRDHA